MIAEAMNATKEGVFGDFHFTHEEMHELSVASWLHDCGKLTVPEHVLDKATKLQTLIDRVELIKLRAEILRRDFALKNKDENLFAEFNQQLNLDMTFIEKLNIGGEFVHDADIQRLKEIQKKYQWKDEEKQSRHLISENDSAMLSIARGTLTKEEREMINEHVCATHDLLSTLPFPEDLKNVPKIAGAHHERMNGKGYPNALSGDEILLQSRILAISDVFEALTSVDRPYKSSKSIEEALKIMQTMVDEKKLDADIFAVFVKENIPEAYAKKHL